MSCQSQIMSAIHRDNSYPSYSYFLWAAAALAKWKEHHKEATRQQEPPLLCFPGHHDSSFLWVKIFSFPDGVIIFIDPQAI